MSDDHKIISLADVRQRVEAEAKKTGGTPADIFYEMFGHAFGFPAGPYSEAVQRQKQEQQLKAYAQQIVQNVKQNVIDPLNSQIERACANTEKAIAAAEYWKAEADRLHKKSVEVDLGPFIDDVIATLRHDPRMPS
jgi:hypothetical protein